MRRKLPEYEAKRDFKVTPEPAPGRAKEGAQPGFVVHKHDATRLHYDVRMEMDPRSGWRSRPRTTRSSTAASKGGSPTASTGRGTR